MLRRDYILNAIEEFAAVLAAILGQTREKQWQGAFVTAGREFQRLLGMEAEEALKLSEAELFARLIEGEATHFAEKKLFMLAALFKATGDTLTGQGKVEDGRRHYLKGLELLLDGMDRTEIGDRPDFVPRVEIFINALGNGPLPARTLTMLMRHYERAGDYARARDFLLAIAEAEPAGPELLEFGVSFYQRLLSRSDSLLRDGNLTRVEVESGLADFRARMEPQAN